MSQKTAKMDSFVQIWILSPNLHLQSPQYGPQAWNYAKSETLSPRFDQNPSKIPILSKFGSKLEEEFSRTKIVILTIFALAIFKAKML